MAMDVTETLQAVAGIGYEKVDFSGYFEHSPGQIRGMLDRFGLAVPSTHMAARVMILAYFVIVQLRSQLFGWRRRSYRWLAGGAIRRVTAHAGARRPTRGATVGSSPDQNSIWDSCCSSSSSRRSVLGP